MEREKVIKESEEAVDILAKAEEPTFWMDFVRCAFENALSLLKEQEAVVHPEPSCEMTYITDCRCDLCGVQLIREDHFCRCCGKRIEWEGR